MAVRLNIETPARPYMGLSTERRPTEAGTGAYYFCTDTNVVERYDGLNWLVVSQNDKVEELLTEILAEQRALREAINMLAAVFN